ncbi:MAG: histidine kinase dimerization/phospho-acceptor domain-containing protein [Myxococcota bacterium]
MTTTAALWLAVLAAAGAVLVAAMAATRRSPLSGPLTLLSVDQFAWNGATIGLLLTGDDRWRWVGAVVSPVFPAMVFHFALVFVGKRRSLERWLWATYAVFGAQCVGSAVTYLKAGGATAGDISFWAGVLAICILPLVVGGGVLVLRHLRQAASPLERLRTWLFLGALAVLTASVMTDLLHDMGYAVPALSQTGSFLFTGAMALLSFGTGLMPMPSAVRSGVFTVLVVLLSAAVALLAFVVWQGNLAVLALVLSSLSVTGMLVARRVTLTVASQRQGLSRFANVGRFSAQMAHDLKNPLAAARGALQFLEEERRQGKSLDPHAHSWAW